MKKAFVTGITGQDGSYLAELLLSKGYEVHGVVRRSSTFNRGRIEHIYSVTSHKKVPLFLHYGDLADSGSLYSLLHKIRPDEVYNLGAQSHVKVSFDMPEYTCDVTGTSTLRILDAIRQLDLDCRFYQASSSEMFGKTADKMQNENTPFHPRSPYGVAKAMAYYATINYRESYGIFASNGILFNHESPRRGEQFVTRKITLGLAKILAGIDKNIGLGNLDAKRDWGYAGDFVDAIHLILQHSAPDDFVIATGETHSVREFLEEAFSYKGLDWEEYVKIDPTYFRPAEVDYLCGDASKARDLLGWQHKVTFKQLVRMMVDADVELLAKQPYNELRSA